MLTVFYGALVSPISLTEYAALPHALIAVSRISGEIEWVERDVPGSEVQDVLARHGLVSEIDLVELKTGEFLMPGFIDTHTHAPQVPNIGSGQQHELLDWLSEVTFPMEARFADVEFARRAYKSVVRRYIDCGTTTCCYYGTLHLEATKVLAQTIDEHGQRAFVGKCNMNNKDNCKDYYVEPSTEASVQATQELITYIRSLHKHQHSTHNLVHPILTPRFALSCTPDLLASLGRLAQSDPTLTIQTHISENEAEIVYTKHLFPKQLLCETAINPHYGGEGTYAGVYDAYGLLRANTILGHAVHLEEAEVQLVKRRNAGLSHCPTSNFNLRSGCAKVGEWLDHGIKVGLGTDVSGGFSPSILTAVQHASICSKVVAMQPDHKHRHEHPPAADGFANRPLGVATLLYLATQGGAEVCGLAARVGSLDAGKAFDAIVVSVRTDAGNPNIWGADLDAELGVTGSGGEKDHEGGRGKGDKEELEGMLERFLFCGDDRNIRRVYVQGKLVGGQEVRD